METSVSIIIPGYNSGRFIAETLNSVLSQTYRNWETIIVDDCSTDHSVEVINEFVKQDNRYRLILSKQNSGGPAIPRNMGIAAAKGEYVAFLDSDDRWLPGKLEKQLHYMAQKSAQASSTSYELIDESGNPLRKVIHAQPIMDYREYLRNTNIGFSSAIVARELLDGIQFRRLPVAEDFPFWLDIFRKNVTMIGLGEVLMQYRIQKSSLSSNKLKSASQIWKTYRKIENFSFVRSLYYFSCYSFNAVRKRL